MTQAIGKDMSDFDTVRNLLIRFRDERNWRQFHTLKNLIISLNLEAAELLELTQWKTDEELARLTSDAGFSEQLRDECADVFLYLLLIAGEGGFDLLQAAQEKIAKNARRYPVEQAYGSAKKYTELKQEARRAEEN
jgi:NTP pyrophosphatase (non-canonical NTP hydrolase)